MRNFLFKLATLGANYEYPAGWEWVGDIVGFLNMVLPYLLIVVCTAGAIYAVVLGVKMARAEDASAREEAKKRVINFIIALAVTVLLIILLQVFTKYLPGWLGLGTDTPLGGTEGFIGLLK